MTDEEFKEIETIFNCMGPPYPMPREDVAEAFEKLLEDHRKLRVIVREFIEESIHDGNCALRYPPSGPTCTCAQGPLVRRARAVLGETP